MRWCLLIGGRVRSLDGRVARSVRGACGHDRCGWSGAASGAAAVAGVKATPKVTARAAVTTVAGYGSLVRRAVAAATHGGVREQIRAARAAGDSTAVAEWTERLDTLKGHRAQRIKELPRQVLAALMVTGIAVRCLVCCCSPVGSPRAGAGRVRLGSWWEMVAWWSGS
ncbi:hypothetical protein Ae717Ps2_7197c [Pseudonocardia sp. Ae717_Ps2]|nr:hypothetical protein Ae717Ps2_7197c [Pseudonocardia sp. Ae717_Ps2]